MGSEHSRVHGEEGQLLRLFDPSCRETLRATT